MALSSSAVDYMLQILHNTITVECYDFNICILYWEIKTYEGRENQFL